MNAANPNSDIMWAWPYSKKVASEKPTGSIRLFRTTPQGDGGQDQGDHVQNGLSLRSYKGCYRDAAVSPVPVVPMLRRTVSRWAAFLTICILALIVAAALRWPATLTSLGGFLVDSQPPQAADLILVLGGDFWGPRVLTGADLGTQRYAPVVLFSGPPYYARPQGELSIEFLVKEGYPSEMFQVFANQAHSTIAEAKALRGELARRHARRVLLVTSSYHSRRAACPGVQFISIPAPDGHYHVAGWWNDKSSRRLFFSEWSKILGSVLVRLPTYAVGRLQGHRMVSLLLAAGLLRGGSARE
jgi:hypothetical protein